MFKITRKSRLVKVAAATAAIGSLAAIGFAGNSPANADPKQYTDPIFGFGSDTTQDVINAFAGFSTGGQLHPAAADIGGNGRQADRFVGRVPTAGQTRPRSPASPPRSGRRRSSDRTAPATASCALTAGSTWRTLADKLPAPAAPTRSLAGIIDFARSSPATPVRPDEPHGPLVYVPFGRDALGFALRPAQRQPGDSTDPGAARRRSTQRARS